MSPIDFATLEKGQQIGSTTLHVNRADLVRYAGASGDFNPIHWNERFATDVGLPGVIAHGMFTMGAAVTLVADWIGDPGAVIDYQSRFTKPVVVEDPAGTNPSEADGTALEVTGVIGALDPEARTARVDLTVIAGGEKVLVKAQALVGF
ncbi:MAG: MaoC family dehydratase [Arthrobacter sp.]|uniref:MaoC family dehydratase n=1 Tax=Arthrobacter sp. AOP36-C1-22 TaxID=3457683 RepID=UPI00264FA06A|nr:MaoC family dehydratase [Micrococcaceae bacterium]MDN5823161.1 MaoC family dehydratase [Micrococcaceae bacterium]MDN5879814.1 MaoC family dehydratase [Micrococcaceae bacterium]MDN5886048.1 MaoC family dehydratase [Micrococcaceae bacterium]MDN5906482.1 MaoC family dehydratase [Micrococcaceae bacterium]